MSDLLTLARDYIERMTNPAYGLAINEDYSIRFARLLAGEGFEKLLLREIREVSDRDALTSHGWLWLMGWAKSRAIALPEPLLVELFDEWSSVFAKCTILDLATRYSEYQSQTIEDVRLNNFPNSFLREVMAAAVRVEREIPPDIEPELKDLPLPEPIPSMNRSESLVVALLQVGKPITLDAASVLLRHEWDGQDNLHAFFRVLYDALDPETRAEWRRHLKFLPEPPESPAG